MKTYYLVLIILLIFIFNGSCANLQYSAEISNEKESAEDKISQSSSTNTSYENVTDTECDCQNGFCKEEKGGNVSCVCLSEYGKYTNTICRKCDCGTGANCTWKKTLFTTLKTCLCKEGYTDIDGICGVDWCASNPCLNQGFCINRNDTYECKCTGIYGGKNCSKNIFCDLYGKDICGTEMCQYDNITQRYHCVCKDGKIFNEASKTCTDRCFKNPCKNGGTCHILDGNIHCSCRLPYSGDFCEKGGCFTYPCLNGGICREESDVLMCYCRIPFFGERCEKDPCSSSPCQNGATCSIDGTTYKCLCKALYTGMNCDTDYRYMIASLLILLLFALICLCRGCYVCRPTHNFIFQGDGYKTLPNMP